MNQISLSVVATGVMTLLPALAWNRVASQIVSTAFVSEQNRILADVLIAAVLTICVIIFISIYNLLSVQVQDAKLNTLQLITTTSQTNQDKTIYYR